MIPQKKQYDFAQCISALQKSRQLTCPPNHRMATPKAENKDQSLKLSRIQGRVSTSPLRIPLQKAIQKVTRNKTPTRSPVKNLGRSQKRQQSSTASLARKVYYEQNASQRSIKAHTETYNFLKKYFDVNIIEVPIDTFIQKLLQQYEGLWGHGNVQQILQDFTYKFHQIFGLNVVQVRDLVFKTKDNGMIGLIFDIFKEIKNEETTRLSNYTSFSQQPQILSIHKSLQSRLNEEETLANIKNVIQQFMETMYQCMQSELYNKFNVEMRRMVLKYRQTQKLLKKCNQKITMHAEVFDLQKKFKEKQKYLEIKLEQLRKTNERLNINIQKDQHILAMVNKQKQKLHQQNSKLKQNLERYQIAIFNKAIENTEPNLSRRVSGGVLSDKVNDILNSQGSQNSKIQSQPLKIQIDTQITHRQYGPPIIQTNTNIHNTSTQQHSPSKTNYQYPRTSYGGTSRVNPPSYNSTSPYKNWNNYR